MYKRHLSEFLQKNKGKYPVITLLGPRQSGKSTLARSEFQGYSYVSLEEEAVREFATKDPRGFFKKYSANLIIDEVQRVPSVLSSIQTIVDEPKNKKRFVLTGSHNLLLMEKVSQSLAGRTLIARLLPMSHKELRPYFPDLTLEDFLYRGGYPRIYDQDLDPHQWLEEYYMTYVERDVRMLLQVGDLELFGRFIRLCAGRVGQILNLSSLACDCGISQPTASKWISILKTSFILFTLEPHFNNFNKRIVKQPKIYFYDTGLLSYLLRITDPIILYQHPFRGALFENWVITEKIKSSLNVGKMPAYYFWRDSNGKEVDLVDDFGTYLYPFEIKSGQTFHEDYVKGIDGFVKLQKGYPKAIDRGTCVFAGDESFEYKDKKVLSWKDV